MMLLADVTKIKCKFVSEVIAFLNKRKYAVDPCIKCKYTYYADLLKVLYGGEVDDPNVVYECLSHEDECDLTTKANKYSAPVTDCESVALDCSGQITISLAESGETCTQTAGVAKEAVGGLFPSAFPKMYVTNNSPYIDGTIWLGATRTGDCGPGYSSVLIDGGVTQADGAMDIHRSNYQFGFNSTVVMPSTAYLTSMRIYETDTLGTLGAATNLDLDPATSPYYADDVVACPGCATVLSTEVQIGDPNFQDAFATLMNNVSLALFGDASLHGMSAIGGATSYRIRTKAKHNPSSNWFGIHYPDARIAWSNGVVQTVINGFSNLTTSQQDPLRFYDNSVSLSPSGTQYDCADISLELLDQYTFAAINYPASSFNKIVLLNDSGIKAIGIDESESCGPTILTATYVTTGTVDSVSWEDPSSAEISTTTIAAAEDPGTYTFTVNLTNGCSLSETIEIA